MSTSTIRPAYDMWPQYNRRLRESRRGDDRCAARHPPKGLIANWSEGSQGFVLGSGPDTRLRAVASPHPLLLWAAQLQQIAANAWMPNFKLLDYVRDEMLGEIIE